ncbi:MAG: radical SAM protein [Candidatus Aminicenantes bacterium]|nr:radical SAM protein [Candidatus Aminicenantes bacterium]
MKVLLVRAPFFASRRKVLLSEPLGLLYLAAALKEKGVGVSILDSALIRPRRTADGFYFGWPGEELERILRSFCPDAVGLTCQGVSSLQGTDLVARTAKSCLSPDVPVIAGGIYPSVHKARILEECPSVDLAFQGESEETFPDFLRRGLPERGDLSKIDGLIYRCGGAVKVNPKRHFVQDLDRLPFPARDLVDLEAYMNSGSVLYGLGSKPTLTILTSRSCSNHCRFCNMWMIHGRSWRPRSPQNVVEEIALLVGKYGARHVFVMDDSFAHEPERAKIICRELIRRRLRFEWNTPHGISLKHIDLELARLMKRAGCVNVCVGIESGSEWVRNELMGKGLSDAQIVQAISCFKKAGLPVYGLMLLGYPGETDARFKESLAFISRLPLSAISAGFVFPFPGTRLYDELRAEGVIGEDFKPPLDDFLEPVFAPPGAVIGQLRKRHKMLLKRFYLSHAGQVVGELIRGKARWITGRGIKALLGTKS